MSNDPSLYNVVWDSPSKDANGSMPIGNGDIGANVWVEENGDLIFYVSKTDSFGENGRLLKVGKVRLTCSPALFKKGDTFKQRLDLKTVSIIIDIKNAIDNKQISFWIDANNPIIQIDQKSSSPVTMTAKIELWRTERTEYKIATTSDLFEDRSKKNKLRKPVFIEPDIIAKGLNNRIAWYHHNAKSDGFELSNKIQGLSEYFEENLLKDRTFGAVITGSNAVSKDDVTLQTEAAISSSIQVTVLTTHPDTQEQWLKKTIALSDEILKKPHAQRLTAHQNWWRNFWSRSWIHLTQNKSSKNRIIPKSKLPIMVAAAQNGGNGFGGKIARLSLYKQALTEKEIQKLQKKGKKPGFLKNLHKTWVSPTTGKALSGVTQADLAGSVTFEAWIKPSNKSGRILDMISPGGTDGFLLDIHPANGLRLIVGSRTLSKSNCLTPDKWHHISSVADSTTGSLAIYLDGKLLISTDTDEAPISDAVLASRSYTLQRFIDACGGRGNLPIKFNGSIFTAPHKGDPDYRRWGPGFWWQNTRLPYTSMCTSGDYDLLKPLFKMYGEDVFNVSKFRTKKYLGHEGVFFPECVYFYGATFSMTYGWTPFEEKKDKLQDSRWHKWEWVAGPEFIFMMLDYYDHTGDVKFLKEKILPVAKEIVLFFDEHYKTNNKGELVMHPSMACETWWDCTNPMPELAGLRSITSRLLALKTGFVSGPERKFYQTFLDKLAPLPTRTVEGGDKAFAPATKFASKMNSENPELYAVYPFRWCSFEKDNVELGVNALTHRWNRGAAGWRQDDLFMTYLGLTDQAKKNLVSRCKNYHRGSRFPAFWGPNMDWTPDQCHAGVLMRTVQTMIIQADPYSKKIYLKPALPKEWNCDFKLKAPYNTTIEGSIINGEVKELKVTPESRRKDIIIRK